MGAVGRDSQQVREGQTGLRLPEEALKQCLKGQCRRKGVGKVLSAMSDPPPNPCLSHPALRPNLQPCQGPAWAHSQVPICTPRLSLKPCLSSQSQSRVRATSGVAASNPETLAVSFPEGWDSHPWQECLTAAKSKSSSQP